jgi:hypothetical protein
MSVVDQEQPKIGEFMDTIVRVKEDLDRAIEQRKINESKTRTRRYFKE